MTDWRQVSACLWQVTAGFDLGLAALCMSVQWQDSYTLSHQVIVHMLKAAAALCLTVPAWLFDIHRDSADLPNSEMSTPLRESPSCIRKSQLKNAGGQRKCVSTLWRCFSS